MKKIRVLDYDHVRDKKHNISDLTRRCYSLRIVREEIRKCVVRCSNCHRLKTAGDFNWFKNVKEVIENHAFDGLLRTKLDREIFDELQKQ